MNAPPVYVVSGGVGYSGEQLVRTVLAQFTAAAVPVITVPFVRQPEQLAGIVAQAQENGGTIVHTLVDPAMRHTLLRLTHERGVTEIDLMGPVLSRLSHVLGQEPLGQPDLYRQQHKSQFERIEAIDFALTHDDGLHPEGWAKADVLLMGVSRVGKTPTSIYLAVMGWKVANLPLVKDIPLPQELFQMNRRRVVGLTIDLDELVAHRQWRQRRFGGMPLGGASYAEPADLLAELDHAERLFRRGSFRVVDVSQKPVEAIASEVIALLPKTQENIDKGSED